MILFFYPELYIIIYVSLLIWKWNSMKPTLRKGLLGLGLLLLYLMTTPFIPMRLAGALERQHPHFDTTKYAKSSHFNIIVLGANHGNDAELHALSRITLHGKARLAEGVRLAVAYPHATLITSGYAPHSEESIAEVMKSAAVSLGISESRIATQNTPYNTAAEASAYVQQFNKNDTLVLVTSALHMPRAHAWFTAAGVKNIITAPADYYHFPEHPFIWRDFIPNAEYLRLLRLTGKEVAGKWRVQS